jgi:polygalacturonase
VDVSFDARGGLVYFPPGDYLSGSIRLKSNVTLYLEAGATIWGSCDLADYNPPYLIYAEDATRIAVMGPGRIDGNGGAFWRKKTLATIVISRFC